MTMLLGKHIQKPIVIGISVAFWTPVIADKVIITKALINFFISDTACGHS